MLIAVFLLISKLDGPPSIIVPPSAAENRELPPKRYVFTTQLPQAKEAGEWESAQRNYSAERKWQAIPLPTNRL
jgi:hypothetical protein